MMNPEARGPFKAEIDAQYVRLRESHSKKKKTQKLIDISVARERKYQIDWAKHPPVRPKNLGVTVFDSYSLEKLVDFIDWTPFFQTWELKGKYPNILEDPKVGEQATLLHRDALMPSSPASRGARVPNRSSAVPPMSPPDCAAFFGSAAVAGSICCRSCKSSVVGSAT